MNLMSQVWFLTVITSLYFHQTISQSCNSADGTIAKFNPIKEQVIPDSGLPTEYDSKGLQPFFNLAKSFMNTVQPDSFKKLKGIEFDSLTSSKYRDQIKDYELPILIAVGFGLLFVLLMPIIGACFCCCRCCGNCGGNKSQDGKAAKQHSCCFFMAILLMLVTIFMLCGVLFMFVTNDRLHKAVKESGDTYEKGVNLAVNYANATASELRSIPSDQVPCISELVTNDLGDHGVKKLVGEKVYTLINNNLSTALTVAKAGAQNLTKLGAALDEVSASASQLKDLSSDLNNTVTSIQSDISGAVTTCYGNGGTTAICGELESYENKIASQADYSSFPNIDDELKKVKGVVDKNLTGEIAVAEQTLADIPQTVATKSKSARDDVRKTITNMEKTIKDEVDKIADDIDKEIIDRKSDLMKYKKDYLDKDSEEFKYENYRYYAYIGLSALMALIVVLMALGLTCGICGYRKDRQPSHRTSVANHGGNLLMSAVGFMFLFSWLLMLFCVIWFFVGIHLHIGCRDAEDGSIIDDLYTIKYDGEVISLQSLLSNCRQNMPIYTALKADRFFNITDKLDVRKQAKEFDEMADKIEIDLSDQTILTNDATNALKDAQTTGVDSINFDQYFNTLNRGLTKNSLSEVITNMTKLAESVKDTIPSLYTEINTIITNIKNLQNGTVTQIKGNITEMESEVTNLKSLSLYISKSANEILNELNKSDAFVKREAFNKIKTIVKDDYVDRQVGWLTQGTDHLVAEVKENMSKCKPFATLYDGLFNTFTCEDLVQNANGFWLALGWCLLFFIPAIILCVRLAKYFRKMDYDTGHESSIDHPPYNDKIPLHTRNDNHRSYSTVPITTTTDDLDSVHTDDYRTNNGEVVSYDNHMPPPYEPAGYQHQ